MNYYDEIIARIDELIKNKEYEEAKYLIKTELNVAYVPRDIEDKLNYYLHIIKDNNPEQFVLSRNDIFRYLHDDEAHQLVAVNELDKLNLRDYVNDLDVYFQSNYAKSAFALLVDSLIRQNIDTEITYLDNGTLKTFNPAKLPIVEESKVFNDVLSMLNERYLKEPSKYQIAKKMLYSQLMMNLPENPDDLDSEYLYDQLITVIDDAFDSAN